jgi:hypothetical protein
MKPKFFQAKFIVKDLFVEGLGYYLHDNNKPMIEFWLADDLLLKQEKLPDSQTGKCSDRIALFVLINLSEQDAAKEENDISELYKARENHDERGAKEYEIIIDTREKERIKVAEKSLRDYLEICSLISNIIPSISLDTSGTGTIKSGDKIGKSRVTKEVRLPYLHIPSPEQKERVSQDFMTFLGGAKKVLGKYVKLIRKYQSLQLATEYAYTSRLSIELKNYPIQKHQELRAFIDTMISLEALFNESPGDISFKLASRCSFVLGLAGFSAGKIFKDLTTAYTKRNNIVHGKKRESLDRQFIGQIQTYAKEAVVCSYALGLYYDVNKEIMMKKLDMAMFNDSEIKKIREKIAGARSDFRSNFGTTVGRE